MEPFHVLGLVREHLVPFLTLKDLVSMLSVNHDSQRIASARLHKIASKYKTFYHFKRALRLPKQMLRDAWIRVTFLGRANYFENVDGLRPRDRIYYTVNSVTYLSPNHMFFMAAHELLYLRFANIECDFCSVSKSVWGARVFGKFNIFHTSEVIIEFQRCYLHDILKLKSNIAKMFPQQLEYHICKSKGYSATITNHTLPY